jgi:hypothetical protein
VMWPMGWGSGDGVGLVLMEYLKPGISRGRLEFTPSCGVMLAACQSTKLKMLSN